jgi:hypothetical protein
MSESNEKVSSNTSQIGELFSSLLPGLLASEAFKDLNFVVNCEIDGEQRGDRFEPKVNVKVQIGRDMDKVLKRMELESQMASSSFERQSKQVEQLVKNLTAASTLEATMKSKPENEN